MCLVALVCVAVCCCCPFCDTAPHCELCSCVAVTACRYHYATPILTCCASTPTFCSENVNEDILRAGVGPMAVEVDIMEPLDIARRPAVHKPALNHVGVWVDDIHAAVTWLEGQGVR